MLKMVDNIVSACVDLYSELPDKIKPSEKEWTVMSAMVAVINEKDIKVLSLGTGSKCIGKSLLSAKGDVLNDSHAEVIARRAFLKYLYNEIIAFNETHTSDLLCMKGDFFTIKNSVKLHFVTSMLPCGDASIMPKTEMSCEDLVLIGDSISPVFKRKSSIDDIPVKKTKLDVNEYSPDESGCISDIHRTGAKCLPESSIQDPYLPGTLYHITGAVRTKPGRGDPTLSLSCSDKIARWNSVGWQGALLSLFIREPIRVDTIICGGGCPFSQESFDRAVNVRINRNVFTPIHQSTVNFPHVKMKDKKPCPKSLIWTRRTPNGSDLEVAVNGRRQGVTKKNFCRKSARTSVCKKELFLLFQRVVDTLPEGETFLKSLLGEDTDRTLKNITYGCVKNLSREYQMRWTTVKNDCFKVWTNKPVELLNFTVEEDLI